MIFVIACFAVMVMPLEQCTKTCTLFERVGVPHDVCMAQCLDLVDEITPVYEEDEDEDSTQQDPPRCEGRGRCDSP